ncbi:putative aldo-keto reductase [Microdochium trichocladiopsis]|uniref:Aldo-keto reductase n=1 Tax=Microdochium trichocladiopsis TaxID=1682393 RepID=A0A9P8XU59_9PEZI|nr:putative aldo-keto reductase [Microdochium trichocladiopsis]KAH7018172.1 putative aldo-keto reductase [Microdochium trichocladiopsis]
MTKSYTAPLGKNGPLVSRIGLGLMGMSLPVYGSTPSDEDRFALLDRALELGQTFWDTADMYGDGESLVGKWFKRTGKRNEVFLATKFGWLKGHHARDYSVDSSAEYCKSCCEDSLAKLGVDYIDLYYAHSLNYDTPIEETMRALKELQDAGKIKHIGLSLVSSATLRRAVKIAPVAAVQFEYSPFSREIENASGDNLLATCRELGVALVVATPLSRGVITADYHQAAPSSSTAAAATAGAAVDSIGASSSGALGSNDHRGQSMPRFQPDNMAHNAKVVKLFEEFADRKGCTVAQLSLAWLLSRGLDIFPIPGTKRMQYLEENWAAVDVELSEEELRDIDEFLKTNALEGATLPEAFKHFKFLETKEE